MSVYEGILSTLYTVPYSVQTQLITRIPSVFCLLFVEILHTLLYKYLLPPLANISAQPPIVCACLPWLNLMTDEE